MTRRLARVVAVASLVATLAAACGSSSGSDGSAAGPAKSVPQGPSSTTGDSPSSQPGTTKITGVNAISVDEPTVMVTRSGDDTHLYVAERAGRIRRLAVTDGGKRLAKVGDVLLDITSDTTTDGERGLLGLAFSADGATIYVSHTDAQGNSRVASYAMTGSGDRVGIDVASRKVLFTQNQPYANHNGGYIAFGPDKRLWLGLGDGGSSDDPENRAQNPDTYLGKMIRFGPDGTTPQIMVTGVRNPWRWSFDTDGSLWIGDVGQNEWEEIDHLPADKIDGANLGWSGYEGTHEHLDGAGRRPSDPTPPVFEYFHKDGNCSVTGGFVYRGKALPSLDGAFLFADYCAGEVRAITLGSDGKLDREIDLGVHIDAPVSFTSDQRGEPYVLSDGGTIVRLAPAT